MKKYFLIGAAVVAAVACLALKPFVIVDQGEEGVIYKWDGKIVEQPLEAGFHWVSPFDSVKTVNMQYRKFTLNDIGVPAQDNLKTSMDVTFTGRFVDGHSAEVLIENHSVGNFIDNQVSKRLEADVLEAGKTQAKTSQAFFDQATIPLMTKEIIKTSNSQLKPLGFEISSVSFSDQRLPNVVTRAIIQTKTRTENIKQQKAEYQIANLKAQEKTAVAEAQAKSIHALADAEAYKATKFATAKAFTITTEAKAQAEANKELSKSITPVLIQDKLADAANKWDGHSMPRMITSSQMALMPQFKGMLQ
ncbi:TPA: SPFH domain-containing protein [Photobacterium damselae]